MGYTILTADEGYSAIAQDNGEQKILPGGRTHLLPHRNFKFEKFMTQKIQTNDLQRIEATIADNVMMWTDATVVWRISDVHQAAKWSAETMRSDGTDATTAAQSDVRKLRNDVLKQATASLAAFIGEIRYSDSFHVSAAGTSAVTAVPADHDLQQGLAKGAVASAEAEQAETVAQGDAKAEKIRAEGVRAAAELLATSDVAVELCKIDKVGKAIGGSSTLFFGADANNLGGLLSNPAVVKPDRLGKTLAPMNPLAPAADF